MVQPAKRAVSSACFFPREAGAIQANVVVVV
jgi:hypothetical protein